MIAESIIIAIFVCSFGGTLIILIRKAPTLSAFPKNGTTGLKKYKFVSESEARVKDFFSFFTNGKLLHKSLSFMKCKIIRIETWIDKMLSGIRKKAKENKLNDKK